MKEALTLVVVATVLIIGLGVVSFIMTQGVGGFTEASDGKVDRERCDQLQAQGMTDTSRWEELGCTEATSPESTDPSVSPDLEEGTDSDSGDSCPDNGLMMIGDQEATDLNGDGNYEDLDGDGSLSKSEIEQFGPDLWQKANDCLQTNSFTFGTDSDVGPDDLRGLWQYYPDPSSERSLEAASFTGDRTYITYSSASADQDKLPWITSTGLGQESVLITNLAYSDTSAVEPDAVRVGIMGPDRVEYETMVQGDGRDVTSDFSMYICELSTSSGGEVSVVVSRGDGISAAQSNCP